MRKSILTLISEGGGGHKSAAESLVEILHSDYDVDVVNAISTIVGHFDWVKRFTRNKITGESVYDWFMRTEKGVLLRALVFQGKNHLQKRKKKIAQLFDEYLHTRSKIPDLIISTIPYINHGLIVAAKKHNIPFLLLPTDLDISGFLNGFNDLVKEDFPLFRLAMAYNRPEMLINVFRHSHLELEDIVFSGFPIRPSCQLQYTREILDTLKDRLKMEKDRSTITLIMGAAGCNGIIDHAKVLATIDSSLQINVCVGRNEKSKKAIASWILKQGGCLLYEDNHLTKLQAKNGTLFLIWSFTKEIISLLACADLVISKTGSCSVNEAIYLGKKLLLDYSQRSTAHFLPWEEFNIWFVKRHGLGSSFMHSEDLRSLIPFTLKEKQEPPRGLTLPNFQVNIQSLVHDLISR